jgi:hypothetical protein
MDGCHTISKHQRSSSFVEDLETAREDEGVWRTRRRLRRIEDDEDGDGEVK